MLKNLVAGVALKLCETVSERQLSIHVIVVLVGVHLLIFLSHQPSDLHQLEKFESQEFGVLVIN